MIYFSGQLPKISASLVTNPLGQGARPRAYMIGSQHHSENLLSLMVDQTVKWYDHMKTSSAMPWNPNAAQQNSVNTWREIRESRKRPAKASYQIVLFDINATIEGRSQGYQQS